MVVKLNQHLNAQKPNAQIDTTGNGLMKIAIHQLYYLTSGVII